MKLCPKCGEMYAASLAHCPDDGTPLAKSMEAELGAEVGGKYRLLERLGRGGMSTVYLARHVMIDRLVAVKTLRRDLSVVPEQRDRFLREARAVNRIHHPNIVEITDFGETEDGLCYLVMEYVPGRALHEVMHAEGPFAPARALDIVEQIAAGLVRAHQMDVIHRDLKPDNVIISEDDDGGESVKVLDFGIAKLLDAPSITGSQQIFGTPGYIAPEYIQSAQIDGRADLYSLGVILYEMVTGSLPFDYRYPGDLLVKHVMDPPMPPRARRPEVPVELERLVLRCLEKAPDERYADALALLSDVGEVRARLYDDDLLFPRGGSIEPAPPTRVAIDRASLGGRRDVAGPHSIETAPAGLDAGASARAPEAFGDAGDEDPAPGPAISASEPPGPTTIPAAPLVTPAIAALRSDLAAGTAEVERPDGLLYHQVWVARFEALERAAAEVAMGSGELDGLLATARTDLRAFGAEVQGAESRQRALGERESTARIELEAVRGDAAEAAQAVSELLAEESELQSRVHADKEQGATTAAREAFAARAALAKVKQRLRHRRARLESRTAAYEQKKARDEQAIARLREEVASDLERLEMRLQALRESLDALETFLDVPA